MLDLITLAQASTGGGGGTPINAAIDFIGITMQAVGFSAAGIAVTWLGIQQMNHRASEHLAESMYGIGIGGGMAVAGRVLVGALGSAVGAALGGGDVPADLLGDVLSLVVTSGILFLPGLLLWQVTRKGKSCNPSMSN